MIYIAGAISNTTDYIERFKKAEEVLAKHDKVINPAKVCDTLPPLTHDGYMSICIPLLKLCDTILMLKGWESSGGAMQEYEYALTNDYLVLMEV